ncbi:MAG: Spx/MgsR family RNA polymerase-binding regulatory protein [Erysipelotrichia bacterium]|nr:Spx/MgsR family RNA polymerase-binding regulatory protein [Erysipelotrichia bacterium]
MVLLYTSAGCASCRKAKQWFKDRDIKYTERNIFTTLLKDKEIRFLLTRSENGTEDLISKRSKIIKDNDIDIDDMSVNELIDFVQKNPSVLKRPIIINENSLLIGYDEEEIEIFEQQPHNFKFGCAKESCPNYAICGKLREE